MPPPRDSSSAPARRKERLENRRQALHAHRQAVGGCERRQPLHQPRPTLLQNAIDGAIVALQLVESRDGGSHALDIAVIGAAMHYAFVEQRIHDVTPASDQSEWKARRDRLGVNREISGDTELALRAA